MALLNEMFEVEMEEELSKRVAKIIPKAKETLVVKKEVED